MTKHVVILRAIADEIEAREKQSAHKLTYQELTILNEYFSRHYNGNFDEVMLTVLRKIDEILWPIHTDTLD